MWYRHRTPSLLLKLYPSLLWHQSRKEKKIYLTFDDGPIPELTPWVLDLLNEYQIKATFFCVGDNVKKHSSILVRILTEGHRVGNHSFNHLDGWKTSVNDYVKNVVQCDQELEKYLNPTDQKLFRPPYGKIKRRQISTLQEHYNIIMWDVLSGDFDQSLSPEDCLNNTINATQNGSIVIFHDNIKATQNIKYALPAYINHFKNAGYTFDTL